MTCFHLKAVMTSPPGHSKVEQRTAVVVWSRVTKGKVLETSQLSLQIPPSLPYQPAAASSPLRLVSPYLRSPSQQGHGSQQPLHHFITPRPIATFKPQVPREVKKKKGRNCNSKMFHLFGRNIGNTYGNRTNGS